MNAGFPGVVRHDNQRGFSGMKTLFQGMFEADRRRKCGFEGFLDIGNRRAGRYRQRSQDTAPGKRRGQFP